MKKRTFVLLRGLGHESRHWGSFSKQLAEQKFCEKVILSELPGSGVRLKDKSYASIPKIADDIYRTYKDSWLKHRPLSIIGLSLGGMLTLELLSQHPDLFSEFFIMNSSTGKLSPFYQRMKFSAMPKILNISMEHKSELRAKLMVELSSKLKLKDEKILKEHTHILESAPVSFKTLVQQLYAAVRYKGPYREIKTPGLILTSQHDELVDYKCSKALAHHLSTDLLTHESAGHDLTLDDAEWVVEKLRDYYSK